MGAITKVYANLDTGEAVDLEYNYSYSIGFAVGGGSYIFTDAFGIDSFETDNAFSFPTMQGTQVAPTGAIQKMRITCVTGKVIILQTNG